MTKMQPTDTDFLGLEEVSAYLKIPKSTIYKLTQKGDLPSCKIGKQLRFRKSSIDKWIAERETRQGGLINSSPGQDEATESASRGIKRILLIDDDALVLRTISCFLGSHGYQVEAVCNAQDALKKADELMFDLVITDINMPEMNGIETLKRLRQINSSYSRAPSQEIVITGYMDPLAEQEAQKLGVTAYIYKPFLIADFIKLVEERLHIQPVDLSQR